MINIMKSQFYQIVRSKFPWYAFITVLSAQILLYLLPVWMGNEKVTSAGECFVSNGFVLMAFPFFFLVMIVGYICGTDFKDKTNCYELMSGHHRHEVYFGRIVPAALIGGLGTMFLTVIPLILYGMLYGWGTKVDWGDVVLRLVLLLFPVLRMVCEFAFITFLIKNPYIMMGVGYVIFIAIMGMAGTQHSFNVFLGITNSILLLNVESWVTYGLGETSNYIYETSLGANVIEQTILASVVFGGAALYLGYVFFKNNDLN